MPGSLLLPPRIAADSTGSRRSAPRTCSFPGIGSIEPDPERYNSQHGCIAAGDANIDLLVEILEAGIADGSIRRDIGDRRLTATTLWGFMHGMLQLTTTKKNMLAHDGVKPDLLLRHALEMASHSIAASAAPRARRR